MSQPPNLETVEMLAEGTQNIGNMPTIKNIKAMILIQNDSDKHHLSRLVGASTPVFMDASMAIPGRNVMNNFDS